MSWKTISSKIVYLSPYLSLREDRVIQPDGIEGIYNVLERSSFVCVLALSEENIFLVSQYRYPIQSISLEIPEGSMEKGETPGEAARRELEEEIGKRAGSLEHIGSLYVGTGLTNQKIHVFVARDLTDCNHKRESTEKDMKVVQMSLVEFEEGIRQGRIMDGPTVASFGLFKTCRSVV